MEKTDQPGTRERLYFSGMLLFLVGLITGIAIPAFHNPKLGLSSHLQGVLNGIFLIVIGLIWDRIALPARAKSFVFGLLLWGTYGNWLGTGLGGIFGASRVTPMAGAGFTAEPWQEGLVQAVLTTVVLSMIVATALMGWGLLRKPADGIAQR